MAYSNAIHIYDTIYDTICIVMEYISLPVMVTDSLDMRVGGRRGEAPCGVSRGGDCRLCQQARRPRGSATDGAAGASQRHRHDSHRHREQLHVQRHCKEAGGGRSRSVLPLAGQRGAADGAYAGRACGQVDADMNLCMLQAHTHMHSHACMLYGNGHQARR